MTLPSDSDTGGKDGSQNQADRDARRKQQEWAARWSEGWAQFEREWATGRANFEQGWDQEWRPQAPEGER